MIKVLHTSRPLTNRGGIVSFVRMLLENSPDGVTFRHLPVGRPDGRGGVVYAMWAAVVAAARLWRMTRRGEVDLIQINTSLLWSSLLRDGLLLLAVRAAGAQPVVMFIHGWDPKVADVLQRRGWRRWLARRCLRRANLVMVLASTFVPTARLWVSQPDQILLRTTMFERAGVGPVIGRGRLRRLLVLSRLVPDKGAATALAAFLEICDDFPELELVIAGDGPERMVLEDRSACSSAADRIRFVGFVTGPEKAKLLAESDVFVFPTRREGLPVALLEAMAAGNAVIASRVGGIPDICVDGVNGFLLDDPSVANVAACIRQLGQSPELLEAMATANIRDSARFEVAQVARQFAADYARVISRAHA